MAVPHQRRVDVGIALSAARKTAAVAVGLADLATRRTARQHRLQGTPRLAPAGHRPAIARSAALAILGRVDAFQP